MFRLWMDRRRETKIKRGERMNSWKKAFIMVDVSEVKGKDYWMLAEYLKDLGFEFTDVNFNDVNGGISE